MYAHLGCHLESTRTSDSRCTRAARWQSLHTLAHVSACPQRGIKETLGVALICAAKLAVLNTAPIHKWNSGTAIPIISHVGALPVPPTALLDVPSNSAVLPENDVDNAR